MGNSSAKSPLEEAVKIKESVLDISSSIKINGHKFNEQNKNDMHRRLINYSNRLQEINTKVSDKKYKEEIRKCIKDISETITQLLKIKINEENLDLASVETSSFVKLPATPNKKREKEDLKMTKQKPFFSSKEKLNYDSKKSSSLADIQNKLKSVKADIETYLNTLDYNQLVVQEKVIEILATDLELLSFDQHSPLQETKESVEKELGQLYRKIKKAKSQMQKRSNDMGYMQELQKKDQQMSELKKINSIVAEKLNIADDCIKNSDMHQLLNIKNDILFNRSRLNDIKSKIEEINNYKSSVKKTIDQALVQINERFEAYKLNEEKLTANNLEHLKTIENRVTETLQNIYKNESKMNNNMYEQNMEYLKQLVDIINKITTNNKEVQIKKESCTKMIHENLSIIKDMHEKFKQNSKEEAKPIDENKMKNRVSRQEQVRKSLEKPVVNEEINKEPEYAVVLRKKSPPKKTVEQQKNIDGFYSYWVDLKQNLPPQNCSTEEKLQILKMLEELFHDIQTKHYEIMSTVNVNQEESKGNLSDPKQDLYNCNKKIIDSIDNTKIKTTAKVYNIGSPRTLLITDPKIFSSIEEINKQSPEKIVIEDGKPKVFPKPKRIESQNNLESVAQTQDIKRNDRKIVSRVEEINKQTPEKVFIEEEKLEVYPKPNKPKWATLESNKITSQQHVESITQIQNIERNVEYLKEKAAKFSGAKQTPNYDEIKNKLDNYRKTLNLLISHQNENITLSCNRVLENIDSVMNLLHSKIDSSMESLKKSAHRNTIEGIFDKIFDIKTQVDEVAIKANKVSGKEEEEINKIEAALLGFKSELNEMKISGYSTISSSKKEVLKEIDDVLYNLKLKVVQHNVVNEDEACKVIRNELKKCRDKINRFSGTYQNILYKEIEKNLNYIVHEAESRNNTQFASEIKKEATTSLKILEEKAVKDRTYGNSEPNKSPDENLIRISKIRQNFINLQQEFQSPKEDSWEYFKEMEVMTNLNIVDLENLKIKQNEPFYHDKEELHNKYVELLKIINDKLLLYKENENSFIDIAEYYRNDVSQELNTLEQELMTAHNLIKSFKNSKTSDEYCTLIGKLKSIHSRADCMNVEPDSVHYERRTKLIENINKVWLILNKNADICQELSYFEAEITKLNQVVDNFTGQYNGENYSQVGEKLLQLQSEMNNFNVTEQFREKKNYLGSLLGQLFQKFQEKTIIEVVDSDSSDGTFV